MNFNKYNLTGIVIGLIIVAVSFAFMNTKFFFLIIGVGILVIVFPFVISFILEAKIASEKENMFLEFTRNLVESVKTGTPISKSILNVKNKQYGILGENIKKLANQISIGIPLSIALETFSKDVNNPTISRALTLIGQAEKAGGDIGEILEAVAEAVSMSDKLRKERKATISQLVVQGYIIFLVFMVIILVMQFKILPLVSGIADLGTSGIVGISTGGDVDIENVSSLFLYLLLVQGFFSGLTIGKLAEGNIKAGVKHSFALMLISFLVSAGANLFI